MNGLSLVRFAAALGTTLFLGAPVHAYNSGQETPGPQSVRAPGWMLDLDQGLDEPNEHGALLELAMLAAGLPEALLHEQLTGVFVNADREVKAGNQSWTSVSPAPFSGDRKAQDESQRPATAEVPRSYRLPGFAGLPDHSLALWDWVNGNELCPAATEGSDVVKCHDLKHHLGALNSTHFPPQSASMYAWYHAAALRRAKQCKGLADGLSQSSFWEAAPMEAKSFVAECEREALALEAFGQHFLQDTWAVGHMWERWGSPNLKDFPSSVPRSAPKQGSIPSDRLTIARLVALTVGIIHGAESLSRIFLADDRMSGGVFFRESAAGPKHYGVGDYNIGRLLGTEGLPADFEQYERLVNCSASGLRAVYAETGGASGDLGPVAFGVELIAPAEFAAKCLGPRATNESLLRGMGLDLIGGLSLPMDTLFTLKVLGLSVPALVPRVLEIQASDELKDQWKIEVNRLQFIASFYVEGLREPDDTYFGEDLLPPLLGVQRNSLYNNQQPVSMYADAKLASVPGKPLAGITPEASPRLDPAETVPAARKNARLFNKSHVADWCEDPETAPAALRDMVASATGGQLATACGVCTTFVSRHVRPQVNGSPTDSICQAVGAEGADDAAIGEFPEVAALPSVTDRIKETARRSCGCSALSVLLSTQDGYGFIDSKVAVNSDGYVAFSGQNISTGVISGFVVREAGDVTLTAQGFANRQFAGAAIQNGSSPYTVFRERVAGAPPTFFMRKWPWPGSGQPLVMVGRSGARFDSASFWQDVSDSGVATFPTLVNGSTASALFAGTSEADLTQLVTFAGLAAARPQIATTNDIVFREPIANGAVKVVRFNGGQNPISTIATAAQFANLGQRPGISADGNFVAFTGDIAGGGGLHLVNRATGTRWTLVDTTGDPNSAAGQFTEFVDDRRTAVANLPGSNGGRILRVIFVAKRLLLSESATVQEGVYVVDAALSAAGQLTVATPRRLLQVGDMILVSGAPEAVAAFDLWDPLSDNGAFVGLWVRFASNQQAILRGEL